jgi:hypothetical protein
MKRCTSCGIDKPLFDFHKCSRWADGLQKQCKQCHKDVNKNHYEANASAYIDRATAQRKDTIAWWKEYKEKLSCQICGESRSWCLDFHHTDPSTKEGALSTMIRSKSRDAILEEITKCVVVCRNCHADIHYKQNMAR